jgi:hypothetical protein
MPRARTYECPGTAAHPPHQFTFLHHPSVAADPLPRYCGVCGYDSHEEDGYDEALTSPHIGKSIKMTVDQMHRQMEDGAQFRADIAQEKFGLDSQDASIMKMTDMRDGLRMGDTSDAKLAPSPVTQVMDAAPVGMFGFQGSAGLGYSGAVAEGPFPNAGARTQAMVRQHHANFTATSGQVGATTSSMPALETTSPNYRRRV